jgi:hypothetical protein
MKKPISLFLFMLSTLFFVHSQNLDSMLLLHYPFSGNANDASGNGHHGTVNNATLTQDHHGNPNQAYYFNGIDSYIEFPNNSVLKPPLPVSISFWIKLVDYDLSNTKVFTTSYSIDSYNGILLSTHGPIGTGYGDGTSNNTGPESRRSKTGSTTLELNQWYFIIIIIRGSQDMDIYVNCVNDGGTYSGTGGSLSYNSNPGCLGRYDIRLEPTSYFKGYLDEFRYWARALTPEDITVLCDPAGIQESTAANSDELLVFPNPADDILHLGATMPLGDNSYRIVNILGEIVDSGIVQPDETPSIQLSGLPAGMYFIFVNDGTKEHIARFIKQ